jgi:hypothetical protein
MSTTEQDSDLLGLYVTAGAELAGLRAVAAAAWDEAINQARSILHRRSPSNYETDIDLLAEPNPYRVPASSTPKGTP